MKKMSMKLSALGAMLMMAGTAFAGNNTATVTQGSLSTFDYANVYQSGLGWHDATVYQNGFGNDAYITQFGFANNADIVQDSSWGNGIATGNSAAILQGFWASFDDATIHQHGGWGNSAEINQYAGNYFWNEVASIEQVKGANSDAVINQYGLDEDATITQKDQYGSDATINQRGFNQTASIEQLGMMTWFGPGPGFGNSATINQNFWATNAQADVFQAGSWNTATVDQYAPNDVAHVTQRGNGNTATVNQYGANNVATVTQNGNGGTAIVTQY